MTEEDIAKLMDFSTYHGVIERTRISRVWFVESGADGEMVYIVGRRHANKIVRELYDAGYEIVRRSTTPPLRQGEPR